MVDEVFRGPLSWRRDVAVNTAALSTLLGSATVRLPVAPVLTVNPGFNEWFNPAGPARRNPQDWIAGSTRLLTQPAVQAVLPPRQANWSNPSGARQHIAWQSWSDRLIVDILPPPANYDWPNPRDRQRGPQDFIKATPCTLTAVPAVPPPNAQRDWPVPRAARRNPQDWIQASNPSFLSAATAQLRSPILWRKKPSIDTTAALSTLLGSNVALLQVVAPPVISQRDWPLPPYAPLQNPQDFIGSVNDVLYYPAAPPVPPVYDPDNTLENEIRRLRNLKNKSGRIRYLKNEVRS